METKINELRISIVKMERFNRLIASDAPMSFLYDSDEYVKRFDALKQQGNTDFWELPWPLDRKYYPTYQRFWYRYLQDTPLDTVDGTTAYERLVPMRARELGKAANANPKVSVEGYFYPHGLAAVVNIYLTGDFTLRQLVDAARSAIEIDTFDLQWNAISKLQPADTPGLNVSNMADVLLGRLRAVAVDSAGNMGRKIGDALTVATIIDGKTGDDAEFKKDSVVHKGLEALCVWSGGLDSIQPEDPEKTSNFQLWKDKKRAGDKLYQHRRGKAVWFPLLFGEEANPKWKEKNKKSLSCYHRNLVMATLQTESLINLVDLVDDTAAPLQNPLKRLGASALKRLERFYFGDEDTYKSFGPRYQILQDKDLINRVRKDKFQAEPFDP